MIFGAEVALGVESPTYQNRACDLNLDLYTKMKSKFKGHEILIGPISGIFIAESKCLVF